jgi:hypothetical protein
MSAWRDLRTADQPSGQLDGVDDVGISFHSTHERVPVALSPLQQPPPAAGEVVVHLRAAPPQAVEVDKR